MRKSELERQYRLLQSAIDGLADPIIVVGTDFHVKLMNQAAKAYSYSQGGKGDRSEVPYCYHFIFGLDRPCDSVGRPCPLLEVLETGAQARVEHEHVYADTFRAYEILATPLLNADGELLGIVESLRDVTERKRITSLLRNQHERLEKRVRARTAALERAKEEAELLYRVSPSAIFTVDRQGMVTRWNDRAEEITGFRREEIVGSSSLPFVDEQGRSGRCLVSSQSQMPVFGRQCQIMTKDGRLRVVRVNADVLRDTRGEVLGGIGSFEDITEQKQVEMVLRSERDKFHSMLSAMGHGMHILNRSFEIEYQNDVLREAFGDKLGQKCYQVYKQRDTPCEVCRMKVAIERNQIQRTEETMADGRIYEQSYAPFMDVDGERKVLILLRDITEEKRLQAETMRAGQLASIGELAAGVAHEINNPINGIINYAQLLLDEIGDGDQAEILARIIKEGERIAGIVRNLLSFARQQPDEVEEVDVGAVLDDSLALFRHQLKKDGVALSVKVEPGLPRIQGNPHQLQQVFLNLLSNARHALNQRFPEKSSAKRLEVRCRPVEINGATFVRTEVTDHGVGIPKEIIGNIFDPFFSSKKPGEGTGLGLSISHGIVSDFHGRLQVESEPGRFTTMTVDLPVTQPEAGQEATGGEDDRP